MKKFLSLMLAMIMVMSLVTVGAGAAFTDAEDIQQTEAVALLSGLGIISGYDDGSFKPGNSISRGAAAKIVTWMTIGTAKVNVMKNSGVDEVPFPDVRQDSSTAVFIDYCKEQGIIGGYSDGTFRPYADLTGHAFLKMVLVALGVKDIDYTATGWQIDAVAEAEDMGLLEGIDTDEVNLGAALSRENACQIAFNALGYTSVESTTYKVVKADGSLIVSCDTKDDATMILALREDADHIETYEDKTDSLGAKVFNLGQHTGVVTKNGAVDAVKANASKTTVGGETFKVATGLDLIGHNVTVYYNTKTDAVYSVYDNSKTLKLSNSSSDLGKLAAALDIDEDEVESEYACTVYDGTYAASAGKITVNLSTEKATSGNAIIVYDEVAEEYKVIGLVKAATKYLDQVVEIVTDEDEETIELDGFGVISNGKLNSNDKAVDAIVEYEGIEEDDYVVVTITGDVYTVEKAQTVTGKATKITGDDLNKLTVGGKTYSKNNNIKTDIDDVVEVEDYDFSTEYVLYLDGTGKYFVATTVEEETNEQVVFYVDSYKVAGTGSYGEDTTTYWAQCVDLDGKVVTFQTTKKLALDNGLYTVTLAEDEDLDDGIEYATFAVKGKSSTTDITTKSLKIDSVYYFTDDVKFIAVEEGAKLADLEVTVKSGVQNVEAKMYFAPKAVKEDGVATGNYTVAYVFVDGGFADAKDEPTDDIVYAVEDDASTVKVPYTNKSDKTVTGYEHTVYVDGVETTIITDKADAMVGFYELTKNGEGYTVAPKTASNLINTVEITNIYKTMITAGGLTDIDVAETDIIDLRDLDDDEDAITKAADLEKGLTVSMVVDNSDEDAPVIVTLYIIDAE